MTLATHIVIASAITKSLSTSPILGFFIALLSHYLTDAIPHWDYRLRSLREESPADQRKFSSLNDFFVDLGKMAFDFFFGAVLAIWMLSPDSLEKWIYSAGIIAGAVLPDFLQGIYYTRRAEFLLPVQKFHDFLHTKIKLGRYPAFGVPLQAILFIVAIWGAN